MDQLDHRSAGLAGDNLLRNGHEVRGQAAVTVGSFSRQHALQLARYVHTLRQVQVDLVAVA